MSESALELKDILTTIAAIWGAGLSSFHLFYKDWWLKRPRIKVEFAPAIIEQGYAMHLTAKNYGQVSVYLEQPQLETVSEGKTIVFSRRAFISDVDFPYKLESKEACKFIIPGDNILSIADNYGLDDSLELIAVYRTQLGRRFKSSKKKAMALSKIREYTQEVTDVGDIGQGAVY